MKKIAYIELDTHAEIALNFMELMNDSKVFSVDYYFSEKILRFFGFAQNDDRNKNLNCFIYEIFFKFGKRNFHNSYSRNGFAEK